ncbi:MAG: hypothetical protein JW720_05745 [Sedimentisphaerales bacterium]|nr:hypothetical protein [Sedimentisphaerales bacterium]
MNEERNPMRKYGMTRNLFVWVLVVIAMMATSVGEAEPTPDAGQPAVTGTSPDQPQPQVEVGGKIQSITFKKDMMIQDALQFLAARYQKNIVPSSKVEGSITVTNLYDVTFEQALDAILGYGFKYEEQGNFINVFTADEYKNIQEDPGRMVYEIFTLYYVTAAEAKKMIMPILSDNAKVEVTSAAETTFPTDESISASPGGGDAMATNDAIIVFDYPENIEEARKIIREFDIRPKQVLVEATIMDVTLTEDMQFGIDWSNFETVVSGITSVTKKIDYIASLGSSQVTKSGGMTVGVSTGNIAGFIRAVEEITDVSILANPKVLAINKQLGQVYIGTKLGYKSGSITTQTSTTEQTDFLDSGTKLSFRPYIANDGYIRMDIHPKDSSAALNAQNVPDETSAELVTNILVRDGETIVIGGLFRDKIQAKRTQIPVLGDIPVIGLLFRGKADQVVRHEVIVLLTPTIIEEPSETDGDGRSDDVRRKRQGAKDELQPSGRGRRAEDYYVDALMAYNDGDNTAAMESLRLAFRLRPSYLEAIRLKERILRQTDPAEAKRLERIVTEDMDKKEAPKWLRR